MKAMLHGQSGLKYALQFEDAVFKSCTSTTVTGASKSFSGTYYAYGKTKRIQETFEATLQMEVGAADFYVAALELSPSSSYWYDSSTVYSTSGSVMQDDSSFQVVDGIATWHIRVTCYADHSNYLQRLHLVVIPKILRYSLTPFKKD